MLYCFESNKTKLVTLKPESLQEIECIRRLPYVYHMKSKEKYFLRFQYLIDLQKLVKLTCQSENDKAILKELFNQLHKKYDMSTLTHYDGFDFNAYINQDTDIKLKTFQQIGISYLSDVKQTILADDVGLGKTIQTILALCHLSSLNLIHNKILIVSPSTIKFQWKNEILKYVNFLLFPEFKKINVIHGSKKQRQQQYLQDAKIFIINYEQFLYDFNELFILSKSVDAIVCDEASKIKTISAKRTRKIHLLMQQTPIKFLLTATPIENRLSDLYSLCQFIDRTIFVNYNYFNKKYCRYIDIQFGKIMRDSFGNAMLDSRGRPRKMGITVKKLVGYQNLNDALLKIKGCYLRRTISMVGEQMPKFIIQLRTVELLPEQRKLYDEIKNKQYDFKIAQIHDLHKACNAPEILSKEIIIKSAKIAELMHLLQNELTTEKVVIFSQSRRFTDIINEKLKSYHPLYICGPVPSVVREEYKQKFNQLAIHRVMIMTSAGEFGLDFPSASVLINLDLPENPARLKQRCGRIRRLSSKFDTVRIINIFAKDTIEEKIISRIFNKTSLFEKFFSDDNSNLVGASWYKQLSDKELRNIF